MTTILEDLAAKYELLENRTQRPGLHCVKLKPTDVLAALTWMKERTGFVQLTHLSVVDWIEDGEFQLTYLMTDPHALESVMVNTRIDREKAEADTVSHLWVQAVTYEQEINEMFGIFFPNSPRMGKDFILEGWKAMPPMRRDFDTVAYVDENHPHRPGRNHTPPRDFVGKRAGERGYLND